jgi:hypothetical protein
MCAKKLKSKMQGYLWTGKKKKKKKKRQRLCRTRTCMAFMTHPTPTIPDRIQGSKINTDMKILVTRVSELCRKVTLVCVCVVCFALITTHTVTTVTRRRRRGRGKELAFRNFVGRREKEAGLVFFCLYEYPFTSSLDEFIQHHGHVSQNKAANVETKEFCGVAGGELKTDMGGRRVLEAWVFDLAGDLI